MHSQKSSKIISVTVKDGVFIPLPSLHGSGNASTYPEYPLDIRIFRFLGHFRTFACTNFSLQDDHATHVTVKGMGNLRSSASGLGVVEDCTTDSFVIRRSVLISDVLITRPGEWFILARRSRCNLRSFG
jgi:hypothetical protein